MPDWSYGNAIERFPVAMGQLISMTDGSFLMAHDILNGLPDFMKKADLVFTDGPWNQGNMHSFYTKAAQTFATTYLAFQKALFSAIAEVHPRLCFLEIGKEFLGEYLLAMKRLYKHVTVYNSTYYHKKDRLCYIVQGAEKRVNLRLDGIDEEDAISAIAAQCEYETAGDFCIGRGLVALAAGRNHRKFVGTELNPKRLAVTLERLHQIGIEVQL